MEFNFWMPLGLVKGGVGEEAEMFMQGIASTSDEDADGEFLMPEGFEIGYFLKAGLVNWHHQASKNPDTIIGEPVEARVIPGQGFHIKVRLYPNEPMARSVFKKAQIMERDSKTRRLGFSIEGQAQERDPDNPNIVRKALITGVAITHMPKNANTFANIVKALMADEGGVKNVLIKEDLDNKVKKPLQTCNDKGQQCNDHDNGDCLLCGNEDPFNKLKPRKDYVALNEKTRKRLCLTKAQAYEQIFVLAGDITVSSADRIFKLSQLIANPTMAKKNYLEEDVTDQDIKKAVDALILKKGSDAEDDDEDDDDEDDETTAKKSASKAPNFIKKGFDDLDSLITRQNRNLGILIKGLYDQNVKFENKLEEQASEIADLQDQLKKGFEYSNDGPVHRKASTAARSEPRDRQFQKGVTEDDLSKGGVGKTSKNTISINNKPLVKALFSDSMFAKAHDQELIDAALRFDSSGRVSQGVVQKLKEISGIEIVAE